MLRRTRHSRGQSSIRPSVVLVDCDHTCSNSSKIISRLVSLWCSLSTEYRPQHHGSIPEGTVWNFGRNMGRVSKNGLSAYKSCNISEMRQDRTKVYYWRPIASLCAFARCQNQRPSMTLKDHYELCTVLETCTVILYLFITTAFGK